MLRNLLDGARAAARRWSIRGWLVTLFTAAATVRVVLGVPYEMAPLLAAAVVLGVVAQGAKICVEATMQRHVPDQLRAGCSPCTTRCSRLTSWPPRSSPR